VVIGKQEFDSCKGQKLFLSHADSTTDYETIATPSRKPIAGFYPVLVLTMNV
jgi:hypothetical protein